MNQARRDHQKMPTVQFHAMLPRELVGRGPFEQEQQFKAPVRVPCYPAGYVTADPADVDQHRQFDLASKDID